MAYQPAIDVESLFAIDVHVHAGVSAKSPPPTEAAASREHGVANIQRRIGAGPQTPDETAAYYRERKIACVIWGIDPLATQGARPHAADNDEVLESAVRNNDVFIPFVMVDPWRGKAGALEAERLIKAGARGFKFHPPMQGFYPNEHRFYELYEVLAAHRWSPSSTPARPPSGRAPQEVAASD
jgi:predicted TIM-barrel fold metal-dependent hydrolase